MSTVKCTEGVVARSICVLEKIFEDLARQYKHMAGDGITSIQLESSSVYVVRIPQEERVDIVRYEFSVSADGEVEILSREFDVKSY